MKKNLIILLLIPFLISTLTIVTVNLTYNTVDVDISYIDWDYDDIEAFKLTDTPYPLTARGVNNRHVDVGKGNELTWTVSNTDDQQEPNARVINKDGKFYLETIKDGQVEVTCSNLKGNVSRSFTLIVYTNGAIIITSRNPQSAYGKVDKTQYYGQFDIINGQKQNASFDIMVRLIPESLSTANPQITCSDNISVNLSFDNGEKSGGGYTTYGTVSINNPGQSQIAVSTDIVDMQIEGGNYAFTAVKDGVNVYDYEQLLYCTNRSQSGEIVVLQTSFESYNTYLNSGTPYFGYANGGGKFDFNTQNGSIYSFTTKYNHEYLNQWNEARPDNQVQPNVLAGLRVQKDFYGNGYQINFHNLAYPSSTRVEGDVTIPTLSSTDLFRGPLPFYTVGTPSASSGDSLNIVTAYGQDNIGFYIDGDNITVNDLKVQNCDDVNVFAFLDTVGTVVEVDGDNVTLKNMRMSNGKNVLRSFSSQNLVVENSMLSNARNFLFITGANEYVVADPVKNYNFSTPNGGVNGTIGEFLRAESVANNTLNDYLNGKIGSEYDYKTKDQIKTVLNQLQTALSKDLTGQYMGSTQIVDCMFYRSGIASVAFESLFNGPFLYSSQLPTSIATFLQIFNNNFMPSRISGTSYPVTVNVSGNTKFYDYKTLDNLDVSGLIDENISTLAQIIGKNYTIDQIFPIKSIIQADAVYYQDEQGDRYINLPFAYYGGGQNCSTLTFDGYTDNHINGRINENGILDEDAVKRVDLLDNYLDLPVVDPVGFLGQILPPDVVESMGIEVDENTLIKTVTIVTGYEPFKFVFNKGDGYLFNESPKIEELQANATPVNIVREA